MGEQTLWEPDPVWLQNLPLTALTTSQPSWKWWSKSRYHHQTGIGVEMTFILSLWIEEENKIKQPWDRPHQPFAPRITCSFKPGLRHVLLTPQVQLWDRDSLSLTFSQALESTSGPRHWACNPGFNLGHPTYVFKQRVHAPEPISTLKRGIYDS